VFKGDNELSASVNAFRGWVASAEGLAEKYAAPPAPVDFTTAKKSIRDKTLVDALEKMYSSSTPPPETHEWSAEDQATKAQQIEEAEGRMKFTQEMIEDTMKEIEFMKANRTTRETSGGDVLEAYPDVAEEVDREIENREWFKDTVGK
jgi:hypothetical protein